MNVLEDITNRMHNTRVMKPAQRGKIEDAIETRLTRRSLLRYLSRDIWVQAYLFLLVTTKPNRQFSK